MKIEESVKTVLLDEFNARKKLPNDKIDNSQLHAGLPMVYYCKTCGQPAASLKEEHREAPPKHCGLCAVMLKIGLLIE